MAPPPGVGPEAARDRLRALAAHYDTPAMRADPGTLFATPPPAELARGPLERGAIPLRFPSRYLPSWPGHVERHAAFAANLTATASLHPAGDRPGVAAICLHGFGAAAPAINHRIFTLDRMRAVGLDVVLLDLPLHGRRAGGLAGATPTFPSADLALTNECVAQAVWDVRALAAALRAEGATAVGLIGYSLGGYVAALVASLEPTLDFVAAWAPPTSMAELMWQHGAGTPVRHRAARSGVDLELLAAALAPHAPTRRPPKLPPDRLAIAAGSIDPITPPVQAERLAAHWGVAPTWLGGGHLAPLAGGAFAALAEQLRRLGLATAPRW
jgi:hypothetical protein